jgi:hypothetical protein
LFVDASGNVGVGTAAPGAKLGIIGGNIRLDNNQGVEWGGGNNYIYGNEATDFIVIATNGNERLRITSAGFVGIGVSGPSSLLHLVSSGQPTITVADDAGRTLQVKAPDSSGNPGFVGTTTNHDLLLQAGITAGGLNVMRFNTAGSERVRITDTGRVGIGTSTPGTALHITASTSGNPLLRLTDDSGVGGGGRGSSIDLQGISNDTGPVATTFARIFGLKTNNTQGNTQGFFQVYTDNGSGLQAALTIDSSQRVGIGTTSPQGQLHVEGGQTYMNRSGAGTQQVLQLNNSDTTAGTQVVKLAFASSGSTKASINAAVYGNDFLTFNTGSDTERARIDSSGRLLVGTSTARANFFNTAGSAPQQLQVEGTTGNTCSLSSICSVADTSGGRLLLAHQRSGAVGGNTILNSGDQVGYITFQGNDGGEFVECASIEALVDGTPGANDMPGRLVFSTTADGTATPTERMRIQSNGNILFGTTTENPGIANTVVGSSVNPGYASFSRNDTALYVSRTASDGSMVSFVQGGTEEGSISVSGTTISYNGAHLSRWSQLPSGAERTEILRGTVLSNLDEMCEWGEEDNEQLNRMKVSDVEGDKNVSGVFQTWDDDDDTYTDDFYCAMTGDFIIRIAEGVTVERGDLLMSAGDGTAKPQGDGYVQDKTIAKVTSTNVSCTYDDGSYCVPCVLIAC